MYQFVDEKTVIGPFVENRPTDEDHQAWAESRIPEPPVDLKEEMEKEWPGAFDAIKNAKVELDSEYAAELKKKVDAAAGDGAFDAVKGFIGFELKGEV